MVIDSSPQILELAPRYQRDPSDLSRIYLRSSSGQAVPLNALATVSSEPAG